MITDWGSTPEERAGTYPCDAHLDGSVAALYRAVDVEAPPSLVFRWLCQLRVAAYSYDWLDNGGRPSPRTRDPENERLEIGQPFMNLFDLVGFERDGHLTLVTRRTGLFGKVAVTYRVTPRPGGGSRLLVKIVTGQHRLSPARLLLAAGDFVMMRKQLLTLEALAEAEAAAGSG